MNERSALVRGAVLSLALYVAAFAVLSLGGYFRSVYGVIAGVVLLCAAAVLLQLTLDRARTQRLLARVRLWLPVAAIAAGSALIAYWFLGTPTSGWGLCGVCALYLGLGQLLAEWRASDSGAPRRGVIWCCACAVAFAVGVILCLTATVYGLGLAVAALLAAPIGLTLLSEDAMRERLRMPARSVLIGAALVPAGALGLWLLAGIAPLLTLALAAVLLVLVGAIASSSQADVLLVVTAVALVWTTIPHGVQAGEELDATRGGRTLVSLGDSYMSGEGAEEFFDGTNAADRNECRRAPSAYAHLIVEPGHEGGFRRLAFLACSGATAADVYRRAQYPGEPIDDTPDAGADQLAQLRGLLARARVDIRLVIVGIGGNDAGFSDIGAACLAPGSCVERGHEWMARLDRVAEKVGAAYREIRAAVGREAPVLAVPYPQPIRDRPCDYSLLERDEHRFLHGFVDQLDGVIRQAARDARFYFLDGMQGAFSDRLRICDGRRQDMGVNFVALKSVNGLVDQAVNPAKWIHNSLHPNERGHEAMTVALEEWLRAHRDPPAVPRAQDLPAPFSRQSLEEVMGAEVSYCGRDPEPAYCDRGDVAWTFTQVGVLVARAALPALLLAAGLWLLWLPVLEWTRPRWERLGDRIARRLLPWL